MKNVRLRGDKKFSGSNSCCFYHPGLGYIDEVHFPTKLFLFLQLHLSYLHHFPLFNLINIINGNSYLLNPTGNINSYLLNILMCLKICLLCYSY